MSNAKLEGAKSLLAIEELGFNKKKHQTETALKRAELLSKNSSMTEVAGDVALSQSQGMSGQQKNAWGGVAEGLLRVFGMYMKGKSAEEKKQTINNVLDVYDWTTQAKEYAAQTQQQLNKEKDLYSAAPSQSQFTQSVENGTLEPTIRSILKEKGISPDQVSFSSDHMTVFVDQGNDSIEKMPVQTLLSPEDSQQYTFANNMTKANIAKSENKQVQGLAQENMDLRKLIEQGIREGEIMEQKKLGNETMSAEARKQNSDIALANAPFDQASKKAYATDVNNRWDVDQVAAINLAKKQASNIADHVVSLKESNHRIDTALHEFGMLESLLKDPKREIITGDTLNSKRSRYWAGLAGNKALSDTELYDAFEKGFFAHFKGDVKFGNMNKEQFMLEMDQMPHSRFTRQGMLDIIDMQRQKLMAQKERNSEEIKQVPNYTSRLNEMYGQKTGNDQPTQPNPTGTGAPQGGWDMQAGVQMKKPDGSSVVVRKDKVTEKLSQGYTYLK